MRTKISGDKNAGAKERMEGEPVIERVKQQDTETATENKVERREY